MIHHVDESQLALYSTRDLDPLEVEMVEQHVNACAECRDRVGDFEYLHRISRSFRAEPTIDDLRDVRMRTMQAVENKSKGRRTWWWASAATAAITLILLFHVNQAPLSENSPAAQPLMALRTAPERAFRLEMRVRFAPAERKTSRPPAAGMRSIALLAASGHAPTMKIATSDPNVIILLPPDSPSDERTETND